jgi:hypothetical protein
VTSTNEISPSDCPSSNPTLKPTKRNTFSHEKSLLPSVPLLETPLGNAFMNISSSKNIPSIPQKGTLRIVESQPTNSVGLEKIPMGTMGLKKIPMGTMGLKKIPMGTMGLKRIPMGTMGLEKIPMETVPTQSQVHILQDQSHPRNQVPILHRWTLVTRQDKKVSSL